MEKLLTIAASNRDRFDLSSKSTLWFLKSLENQTDQNFELIIADGGSKNLNAIKEYASQKTFGFSVKVAECILGESFERARLNNVGIRNSKTPYILTTDVDMFFGKEFVKTILEHVKPNVFIESRTMYWKKTLVNQIYNGTLDPFSDLDSCKIGRIKKRTTAGGCQCAHIDQWSKVRGFDERYIGWGSEDYDLLTRMNKSGAKVIWLGESAKKIMVFHQPHPKNLDKELKEQEHNKRLLNRVSNYEVNPDRWGDVNE